MPVGHSNINFYNSQDNKVFDRELFNNELFELLQKITTVLNNDSMVDMGEYYTAVVVDNADPEMLGRVKATVYGIFDSVTDINVLPWCIPTNESLMGDQYIIPELGQLIRVKFQDGDIYKPVYSSKVKTPMLFGGESPLSKCVDSISDDPTNTVVLFENKFSSIQYNRKTSQLIYKNSSGMAVQISGDAASAEGGDNSKTPGALMIKVGGDDQKSYSLRIDSNGVSLTDGQDAENFMTIESKMKQSTLHSANHSQMSSGDLALGFDGQLGFGYTNPGMVAPDPSGMGPWNALPVDPMTGMPHSGSVFISSGATKDPKVVTEILDVTEEGSVKDIGDNFVAHEK